MTETRLVDDLRTLAMVNYGHFTSMRVECGRVRGLSLHLNRLDRDARELFGKGISGEVVRERVRAALASSPQEGAVYVKVNVFARDGDPTVGEHDPALLVTVRPLPPDNGWLRVRYSAYERDLPQVKHVGTFGLIHQARLANAAGYDDALFVNRDGQVSEGTVWNVCFTDGERVVWPSAPALPGTAMFQLREGLARLGIPVESRPVTPADVPGFLAAFGTNALAPVQVIERIEDVSLPGDERMRQLLLEAYARCPEEEL